MERKPKNIFVQGPISSEKIAQSIQNHSTKTNIGAHSIFLGQVRADEKQGSTVTAIEYTAYEEMALQKAFEIREAVFEKYELSCMHIYHSLGAVKTGEICLFVFTSSRHRKMAIDACEELVERIKQELPVWGKELLESNGESWKVNT
ncbi:molybdenum cofactor biosynthesis protein MoaE [Gillisia sp. Q332]|uniref:molybdenum cofactor biosynthesis protein MoaE n=1 Tax=Gillisia xinjiangensis TaxID=3384765 RepID=UPI003918F797